MSSQTNTAPESRPHIELHVDLTVAAEKEQELLATFDRVFRPAAERQPGYIGAKLLKLRTTISGSAPDGANYRFVLVFESEELRQKWIATPVHNEVWPAVARNLVHENYTILLYDAR
jgi:heme-degrading monooxygenase HmoA